MLVSSPAQAQSAPKLLLTVKPLGVAAGEKMIPAAATAGIEVTLKNETAAPLSDVIVTATLGGLKLVPENGWNADGENAVLKIAAINPNEVIVQRLNLLVEMAPLPPGRQAAIAVEAKAGEASVNAAIKLPIGDCAAAFQAELTKLRISTISEIWPAAENMRKPDTTLPRIRFFRPGPRKSNDLAVLDRLAAGYQGRLLADYEFLRENMRYTARRWSDELKAFAGQEANPGICAVNSEMIEGIRKTIHYVTARIEPPQKAYVRAMEQLRKVLNAGEGDDLQQDRLACRRGCGRQDRQSSGRRFQDPRNGARPAQEREADCRTDRQSFPRGIGRLDRGASVAFEKTFRPDREFDHGNHGSAEKDLRLRVLVLRCADRRQGVARKPRIKQMILPASGNRKILPCCSLAGEVQLLE